MTEAAAFCDYWVRRETEAIDWRAWDKPLAILDLARLPSDLGGRPSCPVIGVGVPDGSVPAVIDVVVEPPVRLEALAVSILAQSAAAAVVVDVLRAIPALGDDEALVLESLAYGALQGSTAHQAWLETRPVAPVIAPPGRVRLARDGDALDVVLDRPDAHNAIDRPMRDALSEAFEFAVLDAGVERIRLGARGKAFSVGAELSEFGTTRDPATAHVLRRRTLPANHLIRMGRKLEVHVDGACIGAGLEMAAFGRRVTATGRAWFQLPELAMGLLPGAGGCVSTTRRIGRRRAALLILSGTRVSARRALAWGLVDAIVD